MIGASDQTIFDMIRKSSGYQAIGSVDKGKVELALNNKPSKRPASWIGQAAWELARRETVGPNPPPPPPPEPTYVKVAPKVCNKVPNGSDPRFCMFQPDGSLRPGVTRLPNGQYTDESGAKYAADGDGLEESSIRSTDFVPGLKFANDTDGVPYCQLPMVGDPTKNTGSWTV